MNIKKELSIYARKVDDYNALIREQVSGFIGLAFQHRKVYELPLPEDCEYESWKEYCESGEFDTVILPGYTNIWDHHGDCHEIYPTAVYVASNGAIYVDGYDLTWSQWVEDWNADCNNEGDLIQFILAVLDKEEDDRDFATITYDGKEYWLRQVMTGAGTLLIGDTKLYDTLHPGSFEDADGGWASKEAERIHEQIFYYVSPDELLLPKEELIAVLKESNPDLF